MKVKKLMIILFVASIIVYFEIAFSSPIPALPNQTNASDPHSQQLAPITPLPSDIDAAVATIQPRDIISNTLGPLIEYSLGSLYALFGALAGGTYHHQPYPTNPPSPDHIPWSGTIYYCGHTIGFGNRAVMERLQNPKIAPGIPIQRFRSRVTVEGRDNQILVNGYVKYRDDELLSRGVVQVRIRDGGDVYVNNNLVMWKHPRKRIKIVTHSLDYCNVSQFLLQIDSSGHLHYIDNSRDTFLHINYVAGAY